MENTALKFADNVPRHIALRLTLVVQNGDFTWVHDHLIDNSMRRVPDAFEMALDSTYGIVYVEKIQGAWTIRQGHALVPDQSLEKLKPIEFKLLKENISEGRPFDHVEVSNPHPEIRDYLRYAVYATRPDIEASWRKAAAVLYRDRPDSVMIEFWGDDHDDFMQYLNSGFEEWHSSKMDGLYSKNYDMLSYHELLTEKARMIKDRADGKLCECCDGLLNNTH